MALYAIGDLHLSFSVDKPMDIFGGNWIGHTTKVENNWRETVREDDLVFLLGDISWALKLDEAEADFEWLRSLPGRKLIIKGNHDLWWSTCTKLNKAGEGLRFMQNSYEAYQDYAICGSRGWVCPRDRNFTEHDQKIYDREVMRIKVSINEAKKAGFSKIIVGTHFPPTNDKHEPSELTSLFESEGVETVIYSHLHGEELYRNGLQGKRGSVNYKLASCDYLNCKLLKLLD